MGRVSVCLRLVVLCSPSVSYLPHFVVKASRPAAALPSCLFGAYVVYSVLCVFSFVSPRSLSRQFSKNTVSFSLREVFRVLVLAGGCSSLIERAQYSWGLYFCCFYAELVCLQGAGGRILEIAFSFCILLFAWHSVPFRRDAFPWPLRHGWGHH